MNKKLAAAAALSVLATCAFAQQQVSVKFLGGDYTGNFSLQSGSQTSVGSAGLLFNSWTAGYGTAGAPGGTAFTAYCLSPFIYIGQSGYNPWDADRYYNTGIASNAGSIAWLASHTTGLTTLDYAAIQVAIWQLADPAIVITANDGNATTALANAGAWYTASLTKSSDYVFYKNVTVKPDGTMASQDLVEAVPEPFTMALGLAGLGAAIAHRRRKAV